MAASLAKLLVSATLAIVPFFFARAAQADTSQAQVPPEWAYLHALSHTSSLPQPPFIAFDVSVATENLAFEVVPSGPGNAVFASRFGRNIAPQTLALRGMHRSSDNGAIVTLSGKRYAAASSLFDPTWQGVEYWLRLGLFNEAEHAFYTFPPSTPSPGPATPGPADSSGLRVITTVRAMAARDYTVTREPPAACLDENAMGDHLHLVAHNNPNDFPVTDVLVDPSGRICSLRFALIGHSGYGVDGNFELDFGQSGNYWVVQSGAVDYYIHWAGLGKFRSRVSFSYSKVAFPATLEPGLFQVSASVSTVTAT